MKQILPFVIALALTACGGGSGGGGPKPPAPENVKLTSSDTVVHASWDPAEGAESYIAYYALEPGIDPDHPAVLNGSEHYETSKTQLTFAAVGKQDPVFFVVTAIVNGKESLASSEAIGFHRYEIPESAPHTVIDYANGLVWLRCSRGQVYDPVADTCNGSSTIDNPAGHKEAAEAMGGAWRLPTIEEIQSISFCSSGQPGYFIEWTPSYSPQCYEEYSSPTIVEKYFPNTQTTKSHATNTNFVDDIGRIGTRTKDFKTGRISGGSPSDALAIYAKFVKDLSSL